MKNRLFYKLLITVLFGLLLYYFMLPPINLNAGAFYSYIIILLLFYFAISVSDKFKASNNYLDIRNNLKLSKDLKYILFGICGMLVLIILVNLVLSPLFNSKAYYNRIAVSEDKNFTEDIKEVDFNHIPLLDKESSQKLGDRVMGQMTDLVSQFTVSSLYTQINYKDDIIRVTPLEYVDFIKYFANRKEGIPAYITVNSVSGKSELTRLKKGMRYMPSALFFENLNRKLRIEYPTTVFDTANFEIDNEGNPYWIVPTIKYVGVGVRKTVNGAIIFNPITGESKKYKLEDVPTWVDHVYNSSLIIEQVNDWGKYKNGFLNTIFGQKGVVMTTDGYSYTIMNDDVYLYTGITSVAADQSNIGFILTNMRTKETVFYEISGAEEYSAMASAEGQVQQMEYTASFPLLINFKGNPTYLLSLKDNAGLVKMYAFVDVRDYQKVVVSDASKGIAVAAQNYINGADIKNNDTVTEKDITINSIVSSVIDGNTYYYIVDTDKNKYIVSIKVNKNLLPFLKNEDKITIKYNTNTINEIIEIKK